MKNRKIARLMAQSILFTMYKNIKECTENENEANAVLSQIKNLLK